MPIWVGHRSPAKKGLVGFWHVVEVRSFGTRVLVIETMSITLVIIFSRSSLDVVNVSSTVDFSAENGTKENGSLRPAYPYVNNNATTSSTTTTTTTTTTSTTQYIKIAYFLS